MEELNEDSKVKKNIPHGTYGGYINHACRCDSCRKAHTEYARKKKQRIKDFPNKEFLLKGKHGTLAGYIYLQCRCDECKATRHTLSVYYKSKKQKEQEGSAAKKVRKKPNIEPLHGTLSCYVGGCRCLQCKIAANKYYKARMLKRKEEKETKE